MAKRVFPQNLINLVEEGLKTYFDEFEELPIELKEAMGYSLFSGGKRFRPLLVLLWGEAFGSEPTGLLPAACAIEYIHTYSLIHDDLPALDDDDLRRGKPTLHCVYGEALALLAGDALFAEAFSLISRKQTGSAGQINQVLKEISEAVGASGMVGGQVVDILLQGRDFTQADLDYISLHKTALLIKVACRVGAILAGASEETLALVGEYGECLGRAFQIVDDILDEVGETAVMGKSRGSDRGKSKATFPALLGVDESFKQAKFWIKKAKKSLEKIDVPTGSLADIADFVVERKF
jgi:geranylgeranyl diphosphate synthase type II